MINRILILFLSLLLFSGCTKHVNIDNGFNESTTKNIDTTEEKNENYFEKIIYAKDSFSNCGFTHFIIEESGEYSFISVGDNDLKWSIYILDSKWDDADRFIPQANELSLETDGDIYIEKGKYVYIQCPHNDFTDDTPLEGDYIKITK